MSSDSETERELKKWFNEPMDDWDKSKSPGQNGICFVLPGVPCKTSWAFDAKEGQHRVFNGGTTRIIEKVWEQTGATWIQTSDEKNTYQIGYPKNQWVVILENQDEETRLKLKLEEKMKNLTNEYIGKLIQEDRIKIEPQKFRHKETGEIVTSFTLSEIGKYEKVTDEDSINLLDLPDLLKRSD